MSEQNWPTLDRGRPVPPVWSQPPGQPVPAPRPDDPAIADASRLLVPVPPPTPLPRPRACAQCGGEVDADGYCTQCGAKAPGERDHFTQAPAPWVGAVCDRGLVHPRNEDALATAADDAPGSGAVLVVCDGVTTSDDSDIASLAAANAACQALDGGRPLAMGTPASSDAAASALFARAAALANDAVAAATRAGSKNPAACTFAAAVIDDGRIYAGNVGDSRVYWLGDAGDVRLLTRDDSLAEESIASGVPRKQAEQAADAHTITRWLGVDSTDVVPRMASMHVGGPGWVLVCSDGLWNYASEPAALARVLADAVAPGGAPVDIAGRLVAWANAQGGHDNISACLARVGVRDEDASEGDETTSKIVMLKDLDPAPLADEPDAQAPAAQAPAAQVPPGAVA